MSKTKIEYTLLCIIMGENTLSGLAFVKKLIVILFCVLPRTRWFVDETGTHTRAKQGGVIAYKQKVVRVYTNGSKR